MFKLNIEDTLTQYNKILGIDEAGRGCCAGPLVVAGVVLPKNFKSDLINDSKKLTEAKRKKAYQIIIDNAIEYKIEFANAKYVDKFNPKQATRNLMNKIVESFNNIDLIITDFEPVTSTSIKQLNLIKGDSQSLNVAAASILAKVARDEYMLAIDKLYPQYQFAKHKGYCTKLHQDAIVKYGTCPEHRLSYKNIKSLIN